MECTAIETSRIDSTAKKTVAGDASGSGADVSIGAVARTHAAARRSLAPLVARFTCPAPASPSIARHATALSGDRAPARSRLHSLASLFSSVLRALNGP